MHLKGQEAEPAIVISLHVSVEVQVSLLEVGPGVRTVKTGGVLHVTCSAPPGFSSRIGLPQSSILRIGLPQSSKSCLRGLGGLEKSVDDLCTRLPQEHG